MLKPIEIAEVTIEISKLEFDKVKFERDDYKRQLEDLKRMIFGRKSERFVATDTNQLNIFGEEIPAQEVEKEEYIVTYKTEKSKKPKEQPIRTAIPAHFRRVEQTIEPDFIPPNAKKIGEEITEVLEVKPLTVFVRRIIRPKYALPEEEGILIAELPSLPIPKGNAGASLLSFIIVSKFVDHLPLYRLLQIFKRQDLSISSSTIGGWVCKTAELFQPLYDVFKNAFLEDADYIQADESPIKVQDKNKKKALDQGYMWVYRNPMERLVLFEYNKGRGKEAPEQFFKNFTGTLQTDGYRVYQSLTTKGDITLLGCMAHARRYFEKALDNDPKRAEHVLFLMQRLYKMERECRERNTDVAVVKRYRMIYALPILDELEVYLNEHVNVVLPKSSIGKAMTYTLNIFQNLKQYIYDGRYEIDNNNIENSIRPMAIGRKNYLFAGSHKAAQNIAMFYSFFASCKANDINPFDWMNDVTRRMPEHKANKLSEMLPHNWKSQI